jgi:hypothetical protein
LGGVAPSCGRLFDFGGEIPPPTKQIARLFSDFGLSFSFCSIVSHKMLSPTSVVQDKGENNNVRPSLNDNAQPGTS